MRCSEEAGRLGERLELVKDETVSVYEGLVSLAGVARDEAAVQEMLQSRHSLQDTESGEPAVAALELEKRKQREKSSAGSRQVSQTVPTV